MGASRVISICADDFGIDLAVDEAILSLAAQHRLTGTSCLVDGVSFAASARALSQSSLQKGLHLNFTESLSTKGPVWSLKRLILLAYLQRLPIEQLRTGIGRQLDTFEARLNQAPDYIDGHQHIHQLPQLREALLEELALRYSGNPPWIRYTGAERVAGHGSWRAQLKPRLIAALGARDLRSLARSQGLTMNPGFTGVYDFKGGASTYARFVQHWLNLMQHGDSLMCHPALRSVPGDPLSEQRVAEYQVLSSPEMGEWLAQRNLRLA